MYNKKKATDKPVGKSSDLNHSSSGKASEKHNFPKQNDSKKASDICPVHKKCRRLPVPGHGLQKTVISETTTGQHASGQVRNGASDHRYERPASLPQQSTCCFCI